MTRDLSTRFLIAAALIAGVVRPASAGVLIASDDYQVG
jgi:hypothetical protein